MSIEKRGLRTLTIVIVSIFGGILLISGVIRSSQSSPNYVKLEEALIREMDSTEEVRNPPYKKKFDAIVGRAEKELQKRLNAGGPEEAIAFAKETCENPIEDNGYYVSISARQAPENPAVLNASFIVSKHKNNSADTTFASYVTDNKLVAEK